MPKRWRDNRATRLIKMRTLTTTFSPLTSNPPLNPSALGGMTIAPDHTIEFGRLLALCTMPCPIACELCIEALCISFSERRDFPEVDDECDTSLLVNMSRTAPIRQPLPVEFSPLKGDCIVSPRPALPTSTMVVRCTLTFSGHLCAALREDNWVCTDSKDAFRLELDGESGRKDDGMGRYSAKGSKMRSSANSDMWNGIGSWEQQTVDDGRYTCTNVMSSSVVSNRQSGRL